VLAQELIGAPRHLSQHPGGFVLTIDRLDELVPIEPAAMADRQVIEWDKDDIDALKFMKVDCLALGMLTCMKRAFEFLAEKKGITLDLATIPSEDPRTYAMIRKADTLGVFQIESRAQMSMLPRMKPRTFYDLVIEVAIVRPGPIQGDMVHPYLRRREGKEAVVYPRHRPRTMGRIAFPRRGRALNTLPVGPYARPFCTCSARCSTMDCHWSSVYPPANALSSLSPM
jgi:error-prone DNA polymerase